MRFASSFYALVVVAMTAAVLGLASGASASASLRTSDDTSCSGAAAVTASSTATIDVPIGSGTATPPTFTATCNGAPVSGADVDVSVRGGVQFNLGRYEGKSGDLGSVQANGSGVIAPPLLTSGTSPGTFTLTASWDGATAAVPGQITGSLLGDPAPPRNPAYNETEGSIVKNCRGASGSCRQLAALNGYRHDEHLGPVVLPSNWTSLTIPEQVFTLTDLERTARGLPPDTGLATDMDRIAQAGADAGDDPDGTSTITPLYQGSPLVNYGIDPSSPYTSPNGASIWYSGDDAIGADIGWMYIDGLNRNGRPSFNLDCTRSDHSGCWGHRDNVLHTQAYLACDLHCAIGAATAPSGERNGSFSGGDTEFWPGGGGNNADTLVFSWTHERGELPACEQNGDTCSWSGQPIMGSTKSGGSGSSAKTVAVAISRVTVGPGGRIAFTVRFRKGSGHLRAVARSGHATQKVLVTKVGTGRYAVTTTLPRGTWTLVVTIIPAKGYRAAKPLILRIAVR